MVVKTFHDIYYSDYCTEPLKMASVELQRYLNSKAIINHQIFYSVERDKRGRLHTHILLVHD